jgi:hypothetical protein
VLLLYPLPQPVVTVRRVVFDDNAKAVLIRGDSRVGFE